MTDSVNTAAPHTLERMNPSDTEDAPVGALRVSCPFCAARGGCVTRTGRPIPPHRQRWHRYEQMWRGSIFEVRLRGDDPRFGLLADQTFYTRAYRYDPAKVTLLERISDGVVPGCNQYVGDVEWVRWVPSHEVPHLPW